MVTCRRRCCCCFRWSLDHRKKCLKLCECVCPPHIDLHTVRHLFAFATALLLLPLFSCLSCDIERAIFDGHRQIVSEQIHFHYSQLFDNNKQRRLHKKQRLSESVGERERERVTLLVGTSISRSAQNEFKRQKREMLAPSKQQWPPVNGCGQMSINTGNIVLSN